MEVKTFDISQLEEAKAALKEAFLREEYDENYNEWEFAQRVLQSSGYVPSLCLTAWQDGRLVGYNILTEAAIGESHGLALGPLGVRPAYQSQGAGGGKPAPGQGGGLPLGGRAGRQLLRPVWL